MNKISLQQTQVSPELSREIDAVVGDDVVLKPEAVQHLAAERIEDLGVVALSHQHAPPYDRPFKCTWYKGAYYCKYYRKSVWFLIWDNKEALDAADEEVVDFCAMGPSITREEVAEISARKGFSATHGVYRRDQ
ncbi:MAG TPA: hypothetical protein VJL84_10735 [Kiloniellales bacterium]|nr:hypothetical protein [Kiloniellales bacterium]